MEAICRVSKKAIGRNSCKYFHLFKNKLMFYLETPDEDDYRSAILHVSNVITRKPVYSTILSNLLGEKSKITGKMACLSNQLIVSYGNGLYAIVIDGIIQRHPKNIIELEDVSIMQFCIIEERKEIAIVNTSEQLTCEIHVSFFDLTTKNIVRTVSIKESLEEMLCRSICYNQTAESLFLILTTARASPIERFYKLNLANGSVRKFMKTKDTESEILGSCQETGQFLLAVRNNIGVSHPKRCVKWISSDEMVVDPRIHLAVSLKSLGEFLLGFELQPSYTDPQMNSWAVLDFKGVNIWQSSPGYRVGYHSADSVEYFTCLPSKYFEIFVLGNKFFLITAHKMRAIKQTQERKIMPIVDKTYHSICSTLPLTQ